MCGGGGRTKENFRSRGGEHVKDRLREGKLTRGTFELEGNAYYGSAAMMDKESPIWRYFIFLKIKIEFIL